MCPDRVESSVRDGRPEAAPPKVKVFLLLSENWTMADPRRLRRIVEYAVIAEQAGLDGIMAGEHVVMGQHSNFRGLPANPRDWMSAGNQHPRQPHPNYLVLLSAIAAATTRLRIMAGAVLAPLHHPLLLAKELGTLDLLSEGRLIVLPSVSWQQEEYAALGVPFHERGEILDEQLQIWQRLWTDGSPVSFHGKHFYFDEVYVEPEPFRPAGPELWFGGLAASPWSIRRTVHYGSGFFPVGLGDAAELNPLRQAMSSAGRDYGELELCSFVQGAGFTSATDLLRLADAVETVPNLLGNGVSTLVFKPSQFIDDDSQWADFCHQLAGAVAEVVS